MCYVLVITPPGSSSKTNPPPPNTKSDINPHSDFGSDVGGGEASSEPSVQARALHDFEGQAEHELSLKAGDIVVLSDWSDDAWWTGTDANGKHGSFPASYVELVSGPTPGGEDHQHYTVDYHDGESAAAAAYADNNNSNKVKAVHEFVAENEGELSLKEGDLVTVLEYVDDEWISGELNGVSGMFPASYVVAVDESGAPQC